MAKGVAYYPVDISLVAHLFRLVVIALLLDKYIYTNDTTQLSKKNNCANVHFVFEFSIETASSTDSMTQYLQPTDSILALNSCSPSVNFLALGGSLPSLISTVYVLPL
jgi:hypothetical protein